MNSNGRWRKVSKSPRRHSADGNACRFWSRKRRVGQKIRNQRPMVVLDYRPVINVCLERNLCPCLGIIAQPFPPVPTSSAKSACGIAGPRVLGIKDAVEGALWSVPELASRGTGGIMTLRTLYRAPGDAEKFRVNVNKRPVGANADLRALRRNKGVCYESAVAAHRTR